MGVGRPHESAQHYPNDAGGSVPSRARSRGASQKSARVGRDFRATFSKRFEVPSGPSSPSRTRPVAPRRARLMTRGGIGALHRLHRPTSSTSRASVQVLQVPPWYTSPAAVTQAMDVGGRSRCQGRSADEDARGTRLGAWRQRRTGRPSRFSPFVELPAATVRRTSTAPLQKRELVAQVGSEQVALLERATQRRAHAVRF